MRTKSVSKRSVRPQLRTPNSTSMQKKAPSPKMAKTKKRKRSMPLSLLPVQRKRRKMTTRTKRSEEQVPVNGWVLA